jgi:hypothetical protein
MFSFIHDIAPNAPPAAAVRVLLILVFAYLYHLQVWLMPASGNRPHCRLTACYAL